MTATSSGAAARALGALLEANGTRVRLRLAAPANSGDPAEQLGSATPGFTDVDLGYGLLKSDGMLLVAADAVACACGERGVGALDALLPEAAGVLVGEELRVVTGSRALSARDGVYGYLLMLAARV